MFAAAVAVLLVASAPASARSSGGERDGAPQIVIGVSTNTEFTVTVEGEELPGGPVVSDGSGFLTFEVDDSAYPAGPLGVCISEGDAAGLVVFGIEVLDVTDSSAVVTWQTNYAADSQVDYGTTTAYGLFTPLDPALVTDHTAELVGLAPGTVYHFRVRSGDGAGGSAQSTDRQFETTSGAGEPLVIDDVEVLVAGATTAVVAWTTNRAADSRVEYGPTAAYGFATPLAPELVVDHVDTLHGLVPGAVYHFRVVSEDAGGETAQSVDHDFETLLGTLTITDVEVVGAGATWAVVGWTTNRAADSQVEYGPTAAYGSSTPVQPALITEHSVTLTGLAPGTLYHFRVRSDDGVEDVAISPDHTFATEFDADPLSITGLAVTETAATWAVIEWTTSAPASSQVEYGTTNDYGLLSDLDLELVTHHSVMLTSLLPGTFYHFRVRSVDGDGEFALSPHASFSTLNIGPTGPPIIGGVGTEEVSITSVLITWTTDRPATSAVRYGTGGVLDCATPTDAGLVFSHSVLIGPVVPRTEYSFVALSACGADTSACEIGTFRTQAPSGASTDEKAVDISRPGMWGLGESWAAVAWSTSRACSTWVEYGVEGPYGSFAEGEATGDDECVFGAHLEGLAPGTVYHYRVLAWDKAGGLVLGEPGSFLTEGVPDLEAPLAPTGVEGWSELAAVEIVWSPNGEADLSGYFVYRTGARPGDPHAPPRTVKLNEFPLAGTRLRDVEVVAWERYTYTVTAVDHVGNESDPSEDLDVVVRDGPSWHLAAYPNPIVDRTTLAISLPGGAGRTLLRIISPAGRVVRELLDGVLPPGEHTLSWDARDRSGRRVAGGIYMAELTHAQTAVRSKLTVLR